ncbi:MAG: hypothetical protein PHP50_07750 [Lachnospiraceae bacterium]|nr:hypothetical protein [Lachnospiraceae bacterium]
MTEQELEKLIAEVEKDEMLQAPSYLKREILTKISGKKRARKELVLYSLKIGFATAAALMVLTVLPMKNGMLPVDDDVFTTDEFVIEEP